MKRRMFGLMIGSSAFSAGAASQAIAQNAPSSSLGSGLTPMGSEMAGNADGSIPAWAGGLTTIPAGVNVVSRGQATYIPELFPDEQPMTVIDAGNMSDHAASLSEGVMAMMTKYGYKIKLYPSHRTAALPQWVCDNIAKNHGNARFVSQDSVGGRFGFEGAFGGLPFPVPDTSNPLTAGAQIIWNNNTLWRGSAFYIGGTVWAVTNGNLEMPNDGINNFKFPYYDPNGQAAGYDGCLYKTQVPYTAPANLVGQELVVWSFINPSVNPQEAWELLNGQGRVRRAPEISFDTPASQLNGIANYDEFYGFNGSLERYDWKYVGKQEMYVPYNNNALFGSPGPEALKSNFVNPDLVRWEKHRCWVVEATLHPGERNVLAKRRLYVDEDTMGVCLVDAWDANNNLFKVNTVFNYCCPDLPGLVYGANSINNLQTDSYAVCPAQWNQAKAPTLRFLPYSEMSDLNYDPTHMAAAAQY